MSRAVVVRGGPRAGLAAWRRLAVLLLGVSLVAATFAADENKVLYPSGAAPAGAPAAGNVTLVAGLVLAAIGTWLLFRARRSAPRPVAGRGLSIEESRSLGNRQFLVVAAYEDKKFLLGVCPGRISLLGPLHDEKPGS